MCCCCAAWSHTACYGLSKSEANQISFIATCNKCQPLTNSSPAFHNSVTKALSQSNASPTKISINDRGQSDDDMDPPPQSQHHGTTQDQPSAPRSPLTDVISHGDSCDKDANPERVQELASPQEISQLSNELDAVKQALLNYQTQSKNQIKVLQRQIIDLEEHNAELERKMEDIGSYSSRRPNHRGYNRQNPKPVGSSGQRPSVSLPPTVPPELQPNSSATRPNSASTCFRIIWGTQRSTTESDIRKVVSPLGVLPNACQSVVIRRTYKPLGTMKSWWFTIIGDEEAILQVEQKWSQVRSDDHWILLKSLQDRPRSISPSNTITDSQLENDPVSTAPSSGTNTQAIEPLLLDTHPASSQQSGQYDRPHLATKASKRPLRDQASSPKPFRILWGTQHSTQESDIKLALQAAGPVPDCASVHKTVRKSRGGTAWWFTITAEEDYISKIDLHWAEISQHPK